MLRFPKRRPPPDVTPVLPAKRPGFLARLRDDAFHGLAGFVDGAGFLVSLSGSAVVAFLGKLMFAAILGAIALGFFLRLVNRRGVAVSAPARTPRWVHVVAGALAVVEVAVLTEATNLPVRFGQEGFQLYHWLIVLLALTVAYLVQIRLLRGWRQ